MLDDIQSFQGLKWRLTSADDEQVRALAQKFNLPEVVAHILVSRGQTVETADAFLNPTLKNNLPNPLSLKDMEKAANRMADSVIRHEPIGIMGDYDVDGATSTALLKMLLEDLGITVHTFIPEREDGYGPNAKKMKEFWDLGCRLVATLDCGMTAFEPIKAGKDLGLDIIVLDHHDPEKTLPDAYAVVNPKRLDESPDHPCRYMAAVGVVFLFAVALNTVLRNRGFYSDKAEPNLIRYLDLVAFGTVCDVMKLQGVNRLFVKAGLNQMRKCENKGLAALSAHLQLDEPLTTYHLGYVLGPRVNACGRVGHSDMGMRLLSCRDSIKAAALAQQLDDLNLTRRDIEATVFLDAMEQVESRSDPSDPFLLVKGEDWHQGVVGIVAGRLKDRYNLPVFALSIEGDEVKGSSRSVQGVDLGTLIMNALAKGILTRGGGHPMAAGFSLKKEKLDDFYTYLKENISPEIANTGASSLDIDGILDIGGVTPELVDKLDLLAPFGEANPEPRFMIQNVRISYAKLLKNGHISCSLTGRGGGYLSAIAFRSADTELGNQLLKAQDTLFNVVGVLRHDNWRGQNKVQVQIQDMAKAL
ncbi:MAG: single-stranded-DNA-specific exonuclease RecJ [Alphaproteobacteria bacterium]|nr:single-stranded-DNA-specific exonuclease RecJ [Alphaproteobacteria bacterium]